MAGKFVPHVAFLRAINVGGHAVVRMADLRDAFASAGCRNPRTFIASGNVVFDAAPAERTSLFQDIHRSVARLLGAPTAICYRSVPELQRLIAARPFAAYEGDAALKLYVAFLTDTPRTKPVLPAVLPKERLEAIAMRGRDIFVVSGPKPNGWYGQPNTFVEKLGAHLGVTATTRNWSTVTKVVEFARRGTEEPEARSRSDS